MTTMMRQLMAPVAGLFGASLLATAGAAWATTHAFGGQSSVFVIPAFALLCAATVGLYIRAHRRLEVIDRRIGAAEGQVAAQSATIAAGEERARIRAEFLAELSHELRTPLSAVLGFSETMRNQMFGPIGGERYRDYAGHINTSTRHMLELLNDVLDLSQAEAGRLELHEDSIDVGAAIRSTIQIVCREAEVAGVRLVARPVRAVFVRADARRLRQMLLNLVTNAIKFTPAGGLVEIRARVERGGCLAIAVRDTGIGMADGELGRAISPFGPMGESSARRGLGGAGIGLSLTRRLVESHGGSLALDSAPGQGTTATLRFPSTRLLPRERPREERPPRLRLVRAV